MSIPLPTGCPWWGDLDFARTRANGLVAATNPFHGSPPGTGDGELWVHRAENDGTLLGQLQLETDQVNGCSLGRRPSGVLDLFYIYGPGYIGPGAGDYTGGNVLVHRASRDGGRTWSDPYLPAVSAAFDHLGTATDGTNTRGGIRRAVCHTYLREGRGVFLVVEGVCLAVQASPLFNAFSLAGAPDGESWEFGGPSAVISPGTGLVQLDMQASGRAIAAPEGLTFTRLEEDGGWAWGRSLALGGSNAAGSMDPRTGTMLRVRRRLQSPPNPMVYDEDSYQSPDAGAVAWPAAASGEAFTGAWAGSLPGNVSHPRRALKLREDGVFEMLYPTDPDGDLAWKRCRRVRTDSRASSWT